MSGPANEGSGNKRRVGFEIMPRALRAFTKWALSGPPPALMSEAEMPHEAVD
jgi:hypothetical protein